MGPQRLSRRAVLLGGAATGALAVGTGAGMLAGVLPGGADLRRMLGVHAPDGAVPDVPAATVTAHSVYSAARHSTVNLITMIPEGAALGRMPVCLVLHGRGNDAQGMVTLGMPQFLSAAVRAGVPALALVAVDGGDSYWVSRTPSDDPQAMLATELPTWLMQLGLSSGRGLPDAVLGISMGGFGALVFARHRAATPPKAAALLSPALFRNWGYAVGVNGFDNEAQWAANEPLRHLEQLPATLRVGLWCGRQDPFYPAAEQLAAAARPTIASFDDGEHTDGFWRRVLPDALRFLGDHITPH